MCCAFLGDGRGGGKWGGEREKERGRKEKKKKGFFFYHFFQMIGFLEMARGEEGGRKYKKVGGVIREGGSITQGI